MTFYAWCPDDGDERRAAAGDNIAMDAERAAEREAERRFDYTEPFDSITLLVAQDDGPPERYLVEVQQRPDFCARRCRR